MTMREDLRDRFTSTLIAGGDFTPDLARSYADLLVGTVADWLIESVRPRVGQLLAEDDLYELQADAARAEWLAERGEP